MGRSLLDKVWDLHKVGTLPSGQDQIFIGLHLVHEVTSPQAFQALSDRGLSVMFPERTFATVDHIVPTDDQRRPFMDALAEAMMQAIERNTKAHGIQFFGLSTDQQGIVHIIGPELGLTQPGMTIACGDSHTSTHGALGSLAFGVGTSQIRDILATQTLALSRPKVRRIDVSGSLTQGVTSKDLVIRIIADLGVNGGIGFAYEYAGAGHRIASDGGAPHALQHEHRGRRPCRLRQSRSDHIRLPARPQVRPPGQGLRYGTEVLEGDRLGQGRALRRRFPP